jgi:hypothetical protein
MISLPHMYLICSFKLAGKSTFIFSIRTLRTMLDLMAKAIRRAEDYPGKHTLASLF